MIIYNKVLLSLTFSISLAACGGSSSISDAVDQNNGNNTNSNTNGNANASMGAGTGGCVTFPRSVVGQIVKRELKGSGASLSRETEIMAVSSTSITQKIKGDGFLLESINIENFTITNNFRDITSESTEISGFTSITTYTPFQRVAFDQVCEGQTWTTVYTEKEDNEIAVNHSKTYIIEAVNVPKTTPAGTFNTFRVKQDDVDVIGTTWFDIASGYDVFSEFRDTSGNIEGTLELIEKNF